MSTLRKLSMAIIFAVLALATLNYQAVRADWTLYVSPDGGDSSSCGVYPSNPCRTIQYSINQTASAGITIILMKGTYSTSSNGEVFPITIQGPKYVLIGSQHGRTETFIDASGSGQNVINYSGFEDAFAISGVTIKGGNIGILTGRKPGTYGTPHVTITDDDILNNVIGVYTSYTDGDISGNNFSANVHYGIYEDHSTVNISRNSFGFNCTGGITSYDAAIYLDNTSPQIENNLIGWNNGSGIYISGGSSTPTIINNTISFNYGGSGIAVFNGSNPTVVNNIITSNGYIGIHTSGYLSSHNTYNDVWANGYADYLGTSSGEGSISKDPRFVSWFDAHLLCSSPAINAGTNTGAPWVDYDNNPRPVGGIMDMGAYEKQQPICAIYLPLIKR